MGASCYNEKTMKQYVTSIQLDELSYKAKKILREWCVKKDYAVRIIMDIQDAITKQMFGQKMDVIYEVPPLSIGQMIEFLYDNGIMNTQSFSENLCDVLWEMVKDTLKSKECIE